MLLTITNKGIEGYVAHVVLEAVGLYTNKQTIPNDPKLPFYPSGLRLGTPTMTTRGMKAKEARIIADFIDKGIVVAKELVGKKYLEIGNENRVKDQEARKAFKKDVWNDKEIISLRKKVRNLCKSFPLPQTTP